ncbi:hypothetical protein [Caldisericum exile]|uniref:Uncharacterized protein n=1 Tax=Caldisericum exile (strain DSM 21853 / NBRC 104410 / AZM16c01) TaxID=511051 RepID=A0A7U6JFH9_CALEA|nr:hypothetical protein [Caldisericum exile]BAL80150.1 hypothetical protein CSE_00240 [Caldisericum exile AZM16c01]
MKKFTVVLILLIAIIIPSCAKKPSEFNFDRFNAKSVVEAYIKYINDANYDKSFALALSKSAIVWPGIGILEELTNSKVKDKYVEINLEHISNPVNLGNSPDEVEIVTQMHLKPTNKGGQYGMYFPTEKDTFMIFYLIKRSDGYKLSKSFETDSLIANYVETNPELFTNIKSAIPNKVKSGDEVEIVFDLNPPKALGNIGEVSFILYPEPSTPKYPYNYETVFYSGDDVSTIKMRHFALIKSENSKFPEEHPEINLGPIQIDEEAQTGKYRIYLQTNGILFPISPYIIEVS